MMPSTDSWHATSRVQNLGGDEVHIWRVRLDAATSTSRELSELLSAEERHRARSFYFHQDRDRYVTARGYLRVILSRYLAIEPDSLQFDRNPHGKPFLIGPGNSERLNFNVSHSGSLALYGITRRRRIGIDVERIRDDIPHKEIADHFFSSAEAATLRALPAELRTKAFFDCWTKKEAYVKGRGEGLGLAFERFSVSIDQNRPGGLIENQVYPADESLWSLRAIDPDPGYAAAVAVEGRDWSMAGFDMPGSRERGNGASPARLLPARHEHRAGVAGSLGRSGPAIERPAVTGGIRETESGHGA